VLLKLVYEGFMTFVYVNHVLRLTSLLCWSVWMRGSWLGTNQQYSVSEAATLSSRCTHLTPV
jgi:hypothetical protein